MTHLLLISYSGGIQKCRTVGELARAHDYDVTMLTTDVAPGLRKDLPENVNIIEVPDPKPTSVYRPFWVWKARKAGRQIFIENNIDIVFSWQVPIASHLVALSVTSRRYIPWVAHFGDPWIGNPYATGLLRKLIYSKYLERSLVRRADRLTFPTDRMRKMYEQRHNIPAGKAHTVPNNINPNEIRSIKPKLQMRIKSDERNNDNQGDNSGCLHLVHTGSFYGPRTPEPLFTGIDRLNADVRNHLTVTLVGDMNEYEGSVAESGVSDVIQPIGRVPKDEALAYAKSADVLVLVDAPVKNSPFLATKLVEYLFMNKPILGITPESGTAADIIRETEAGVITPPSKPGTIAESIEMFYQQASEGTLDVTVNKEEREQYTSKSAVKRLSNIFNNII